MYRSQDADRLATGRKTPQGCEAHPAASGRAPSLIRQSALVEYGQWRAGRFVEANRCDRQVVQGKSQVAVEVASAVDELYPIPHPILRHFLMIDLFAVLDPVQQAAPIMRDQPRFTDRLECSV